MSTIIQALLPKAMPFVVTALLLVAGGTADFPWDLPWVVQAVALGCGFALSCIQIRDATGNGPARPWLWMLLLAALLIFAWYGLNRILAIFVSGCLFLAVHFILGFLRSVGHPPKTARVMTQVLLIGIALAASPPTVSRIVISLENLAVPSKFQLHSDAGARLQHLASKSFGSHSFEPVEVNLAANNVGLHSPMPWIQFQSRRDTRFVIDRIEYRYLHLPIAVLGPGQLQQLELDPRSDPMVLAPTENGIKIEGISAGESAWIRLPPPLDGDGGTQIRILTALVKVVLWLLICSAYLHWVPPAVRRVR